MALEKTVKHNHKVLKKYSESDSNIEQDTLDLMMKQLKHDKQLHLKAEQEMHTILESFHNMVKQQYHQYNELHQAWTHTDQQLDQHIRGKLILLQRRLKEMQALQNKPASPE